VLSIADRRLSESPRSSGGLDSSKAPKAYATAYARRVPVYLKPTAASASDAVLPSDPGHALLLAQNLLGEPRMSNHSHGLWGYHGETEAGRPLTVQSTGIGGPSAAIVLRELHELGVRRAVRIGACTPLQPGLEHGEAIVVTGTRTGDGTSAALGAGGSVSPDPALSDALSEAAGPGARAGLVASTDLFYGGGPGPAEALAVDLESAALFALGGTLGLAVAALLVVGSAPPDEAMIRLGAIASAALAVAQVRSPGFGIASRA